MLLTTLHWPDEVRAMDELNLPEDEIEIKPSEKKMAEQLVAEHDRRVRRRPTTPTTTARR